ncbi:MAG: alanine--tRNA ligase [Oscillospiraceae bacterium]|nr:alanine--tRNA ligase [Oscillospiraceae bacterium]
MQKMGLNEIREKYLSFFESKDHLRQPSFSLIPEGDASMLLVSSGMAPMKPYFSGDAKPPSKRITSCQKCVRVIDIENVGKTSRHCTFFEMLGNFSFGDYFKREALAWTWELLTRVMGIDLELLYPSVYLEDDEAWDIWVKEIGVPESRVVRLGKEDNFWEIGSGPCGPCSEIYFDRGAENGCGSPDCKPGCDCDRFIEVGNNVFTQLNNDGQGNYSELSQKNIDYGGGLERLACVVQGVDNVFEVDTITRIRRHMSQICGVEYSRSEKSGESLRIVTDHIRSTVMLICDGVQPSNEKRGYVLRRLLRRAARHGRLLGVTKPFLCDLAETVIQESGEAYPELLQRAETIKTVIRIEEERFQRTIDAGLSLLQGEIVRHMQDKKLSGDEVFLLYDTYGFPVDLTLEILREQGLEFDRERFDELMTQQRKRAREARAQLGISNWATLDLGLDKDVVTEFIGYDVLSSKEAVLAVSDDVLVLEKTPFYAESGGQCADTGTITGPDGVFRVDGVKKLADGKILHIGETTEGEIKKGQYAIAAVDAERRAAVMRAHSATHLLQKALRGLLGDHVEQAGSQVEPDHLRFDYTHFSALTPEQIKQINREVNEHILLGHPVSVETMSPSEAKERGAMALFSEKYGETVRVVSMGSYSMELCGGTHLDNTAKAGSFRITTESSIAAGVRRIEAVTGLVALELAQMTDERLRAAAEQFKAAPGEFAERISLFMAEHKRLKKENEALQSKLAGGAVDEMLHQSRQVNGFTWLFAQCQDAAALRDTGAKLRDKQADIIAVLYAVEDGKITFCAVCGKDAMNKGIKAGDIVKIACSVCGGNGGGRPDVAMGGGTDASRLNEAEKQIAALLNGKG